jgi:hypothetical protein
VSRTEPGRDGVDERPTGRALLLDALAEIGLAIAALGTLAGAGWLVDRGWRRHQVVTAAGVVAFLGLAAFGLVLHLRGRPVRTVLSAVAVGAGVLVLSWVVVLLMGCC